LISASNTIPPRFSSFFSSYPFSSEDFTCTTYSFSRQGMSHPQNPISAGDAVSEKIPLFPPGTAHPQKKAGRTRAYRFRAVPPDSDKQSASQISFTRSPLVPAASHWTAVGAAPTSMGTSAAASAYRGSVRARSPVSAGRRTPSRPCRPVTGFFPSR